jgi:hypothetical protein
MKLHIPKSHGVPEYENVEVSDDWVA